MLDLYDDCGVRFGKGVWELGLGFEREWIRWDWSLRLIPFLAYIGIYEHTVLTET